MPRKCIYPIMDHRGSVVALTDETGTTTARREYDAFGEVIAEWGDWSALGLGYQSNWVRLSEDLYLTESGRVYHAKTGRFLQRDQSSGVTGAYQYVRNNPATHVDPDGRADIPIPGTGTVINTGEVIADLKRAIAKMVTGSAEVSHEVFMQAATVAQKYPWLICPLNSIIDAARPKLAKLVNTNTETLTWRDLVMIWLLELNGNPIVFGPNAHTTKVLKEQEGVKNARELAMKAKAGETVKYTWLYGQKEFWTGVTEGNWCTSFLGSYTVTVEVKMAEAGGKCKNKFTVQNKTTWESGTRLRKAAEPGGPHQAIVPNRQRGGAGIHLGGDMEQVWKWEEDR